MSAQSAERTGTARGIVLNRDPAGEHHLRLAVLDPEAGLLAIHWRLSRKRPTAGDVPDLFDEGEFTYERSARGPGLFAREFRLTHSRRELAARYEAFRLAGAFCRILADNAAHLAEPAPLHALCTKALDGFSQPEAAPEAVHLKACFQLCRQEGYPAREGWLAGLHEPERAEAARLLNTPLASLAPHEPAAPALADALLAWMRRHTDFYL
jgi:recombinational DNA repair protein (RecF pathway)